MLPESLTVIVLTYNEDRRLDRALASIPRGAAIFVLDAHSSDATLEIAKRYRATVEQREWITFADARRYAITRVTTPWLCMLDADEELLPGLNKALLEAGVQVAGYRCIRLNRFCGAIMRGGTWANETVLRFAQTAHARIEAQAAGDLHEQLVVDGEIGDLYGAIDHDSYPTIASYWKKFHRYTAIEAANTHASFGDVVALLPRAFARMMWHFVVKRGYRDGWRGGFVAAASAAYPVAVLVRAWRHPVSAGRDGSVN